MLKAPKIYRLETDRGDLILERLRCANTPWSRMRGLLGEHELAGDNALWIIPCNSIHMLFMKFAIDAVFLDRQKQIVRISESLQPWRFFRGGKAAHSVLELPIGTVKRCHLKVGDRLKIIPHTTS